jgi:hypothetical protein
MTWRWVTAEDGHVTGAAFAKDNSFFALKPITQHEREFLSNELQVRGAVWGILYAARQAFAVGTADYDNAVENLGQLVKQLFHAEAQIAQVLLGVAPYIDGGAWERCGPLEAKIAFAKDVMQHAPEPKAIATPPKAIPVQDVKR